MKFMTKEYVKEQSALGVMASLKCSLEHHHQGATCTRGELIDATESQNVMSPDLCACCAKYTCCHDTCPLSRDGMYGACCGGTFRVAESTLRAFKSDPTPANFAAFQEAERKVCDYIQAVIDKETQPEETYSVGDRFYRDCKCNGDNEYILISSNVDEVMLTRLATGGRVTCSRAKVKGCYAITQKEFAAINYSKDFTRYWDNAKQQKVGEEPKLKAKSAPEVKSEPKLRHGDIVKWSKNEGIAYVAIEDENGTFHWPWMMGNNVRYDTNTAQSSAYTILGNIFDDIANRGKKIEGFEMRLYSGRVDVHPANDGRDLVIKRMNEHDNYTLIVRHEDIEEFHLRLGHVLNHIKESK